MPDPAYSVLDLFSAAAGGWSLGMDRAGFHTVAACEIEEWRRVLYSENNPDAELFDDVRSLTRDQLLERLGYLPRILVGSPPCQDISSANTKGRGVDGEQSKLFFEAVRLIDEIRPRWFALENSPYLRTRGIDRVAAALEALGYASEPLVVGADHIRANHERDRVWIVGFDPDQVVDAARLGCEGRRSWGRGAHGDGGAPDAPGAPGYAHGLAGVAIGQGLGEDHGGQGQAAQRADRSRKGGARAFEGTPVDGAGAGLGDHGGEPWAHWNGGLGRHLQHDDGLSAQLADLRFYVGAEGRKTASGASFIVEAFGDSVVPQITEAIGRAILRTEAALAAIYGREAA